MSDALEQLNAEQHAAVVFDRGPLMVLAGPGTGKTRVITHRIAHMIRDRGVDPEQIVAVTYTTKAAAQLRDRLAALVGTDAERVHAHTFHGLGYRIVRRFADEMDLSLAAVGEGGGIIDSAQQRRTLREIVVDLNLFRHARAQGLDAVVDRIAQIGSAISDAAISPDDAAAFVERARESLREGRNAKGETLDEIALAAERERVRELAEACRVLQRFEEACRARGWLSYGDLIALPIRILRRGGHASAILRDQWRHMVVDEFQDVNTAQIELLRALMPSRDSGGSPDLCVVGDDDQSIYAFRGADDRAFARFKAYWPSAAQLELRENYRSTPSIVAVANATIGLAENRFAPGKVIVSAAKLDVAPGPVECVHLENDAQAGDVIAAAILMDRASRPEEDRAWSRYAVVTKIHAHADRVRAALEMEGIPARAAREGSPENDEGVRDVLAWLELLSDPSAVHAASRLMHRPPISMDAARVHRLLSSYRAQLSRFQSGDPGERDPGGLAEWLEGAGVDDPGVAAFLAMHATIRSDAAAHDASALIERIIAHADAAHADLLSGRERAKRVASLVALVRFARERLGRLDEPRDGRAFWNYWTDLSEGDRRLGSESHEDRIDGLRPEPEKRDADAVTILTAHSAKGLEFHTVFVPNISPKAGYGASKARDEAELPSGLINADDARSAKERAVAEERRLFYVACTRAERRLVLCAAKLKSISKSQHYFQQLTMDAKLKSAVQCREGAELLGGAAKIGLRKAAGWAGDSSEIGGPGYKSFEVRREAFEDARRETRRIAAGALDVLASPQRSVDEAAAAEKALESAGRRMRALAEAEQSGSVPAWAERTPEGELVSGVLARAAAGERVDASAPWGPLSGSLKLSYTHIDQYLRCPRCFYLRYVLRLKPLEGAAQIVGISVHEALERFYKELRNAEAGEGRQPGRDRLLELGRAAFATHWPKHLEVDRIQLDQVLAQLGVAFDELIAREPQGVSVLEIEQRIEFPHGSHRFEAKIDRIDQITGPDGRARFRIVDYKTGQSRKDLCTPRDDDMQLGIYTMALAKMFELGDPIAQPLQGSAEYWILSTGERGVIDLATLDLAGIHAEIDGAIAGMLKGEWNKGKKCRGECDMLGSVAAVASGSSDGAPELADVEPDHDWEREIPDRVMDE